MEFKIDKVDKLLFLMGFMVPYFWWLKGIRKSLIKGEITQEEALKLAGIIKNKEKATEKGGK